MKHLVESFLKERETYQNSDDKDKVKDNMEALGTIESELYDYIFRIYLCSYVKKTITFAALQIKKKITKINTRESLILNTTYPDSDKERLNFIADKETDFIEDIFDISDFNEISQDKNIVQAIDALTDRQKEIIYYCVLLGESDTCVAKKIGITKQGVNKTKITALNKLRRILDKIYTEAV